MELPENNEKNQKRKVKFKIMSLKVKEGTDYVPELVSFMIDSICKYNVGHDCQNMINFVM